MRFTVLGAIVLSTLLATLLIPGAVRAYDLPYDPYPWCANYGGDASGSSNCGFLTLEQCRATVRVASADSAITTSSTIRDRAPHASASATTRLVHAHLTRTRRIQMVRVN